MADEFVVKDGKKYRKVARNTADIPEARRALEAEANKDLPETGHWRTEALKRNRDELEAAVNAANEYTDGAVGTVDLGKIPLDNDIVKWMDGTGNLAFDSPRPDMVYCLIRRKTRIDEADTAVEWMRGLGWQIVVGTASDCPEAKEWLQADGTRKIGDTVLMRMEKGRYAQYRAWQKRDRVERHNPDMLNSRIEQVAMRNSRVVTVRTDPNDPAFQDMMRRSQAASVATERFTNLIKGGRVPGREVPR